MMAPSVVYLVGVCDPPPYIMQAKCKVFFEPTSCYSPIAVLSIVS